MGVWVKKSSGDGQVSGAAPVGAISLGLKKSGSDDASTPAGQQPDTNLTAGDRPLIVPASLQRLIHLEIRGRSGYLTIAESSKNEPEVVRFTDEVRARTDSLSVDFVDLESVKAKYALAKAGKGGDALKTLEKAVQLIVNSATEGASDVHVLIREDKTEIMLRIKGDLQMVNMPMSAQEGEVLLRAIYNGLAANKDPIYNPYEYQDAMVPGNALPGGRINGVRIVRGPCYPVEKRGGFMVMRIVYAQGGKGSGGSPLVLEKRKPPEGALRLGSMGYTPLQVELIETLCRVPSGVILVTGPTGSGKSSTLTEVLTHQARLRPAAHQITIENPVENPLPWACQLPTSSDAFLKAVKTTLRMDPDIVLVGELRDADEAIAALQEAMTGHTVYSTLHVNDAYMCVDRLEMMDQRRLSRAIVCDHKLVRGLISQRLIPVLCEGCKKPLSEAADEFTDKALASLALWGPTNQVFVRGEGCPKCNHHGIKGVQAVAEVVVTSGELMRDYRELGTDAARRNHRMRPGSDRSMLTNAMELVFQGRVDPRDVESSVDVIGDPADEGVVREHAAPSTANATEGHAQASSGQAEQLEQMKKVVGVGR